MTKISATEYAARECEIVDRWYAGMLTAAEYLAALDALHTFSNYAEANAFAATRRAAGFFTWVKTVYDLEFRPSWRVTWSRNY